jgi:uncharacterized protein YfaQ (DUF2300 family)
MGRTSRAVALGLAAWIGCAPTGASAELRQPPCQRNPRAERWLADQAPRWHRQLYPVPGFEDPGGVQVCVARSGSPRADTAANRIWLRHVNEAEDRRSLAHEYLHLAFKRSPKTLDEAFIESAARRVLEGEP